MTTPKVERLYNEAIDAMTGAERVQRACALYDSVHLSMAHQIRQAEPELSDGEVRLRVARLMYLTDLRAQSLLDRVSVG